MFAGHKPSEGETEEESERGEKAPEEEPHVPPGRVLNHLLS